MQLRSFNYGLANKLVDVADELGRAGYWAVADGIELLTSAPKPRVRVALARSRIFWWRECNRCGLAAHKYQF